nr:hypothetical protein [uncultured Rhodopila sp.]
MIKADRQTRAMLVTELCEANDGARTAGVGKLDPVGIRESALTLRNERGNRPGRALDIVQSGVDAVEQQCSGFAHDSRTVFGRISDNLAGTHQAHFCLREKTKDP